MKKIAIYDRSATINTDTVSNHTATQESLIQSLDADSVLVDVYYDSGRSGACTANRPEFQRLLADCRTGKVDCILTKSISRFSRNVGECSALVNELLAYDVDVFFEKEGIHSKNMEDTANLMLPILARFAEEEATSITKNNWRI